MSFHREAMSEARRALRDAAGRPAAYFPPTGPRVDGVVVRHVSFEDVSYDTDAGPVLRRELVVAVEIGPSPGRLAAVHKDGRFVVDVGDAAGPQAFVVESFAGGDAGWRRCLCVQEIKQGGRAGLPRPTR